MTLQLESISLNDARRMISAGEAKQAEIDSPSNIAVVDVGGNFVAHVRMDEAWIGSVDISINKAFTTERSTSSPTRRPTTPSNPLRPGRHRNGIHFPHRPGEPRDGIGPLAGDPV